MKRDYFNNPAKYLEDRGIVYKYENKIYKSTMSQRLKVSFNEVFQNLKEMLSINK